ncbi:MAG: hypothetical protein FJX68_12680 [Alphaproteobacteria bacterium]|nr:hypothetical protein [Alphaproteobacteria bacterium]
MTFRITDERAGSQPIANVSTTQLHPFGTIVRAVDDDYGEGEFIYLKGVANTVVGSWATYNVDDWTTTLLAANAIGPVAIAMSATDATTDYGWYQISGKAVGLCLTGFADDGLVFATATAGAIDDASVNGDLVNLAKGASAKLATTAEPSAAHFEIHRPFVNDNSNSA